MFGVVKVGPRRSVRIPRRFSFASSLLPRLLGASPGPGLGQRPPLGRVRYPDLARRVDQPALVGLGPLGQERPVGRQLLQELGGFADPSCQGAGVGFGFVGSLPRGLGEGARCVGVLHDHNLDDC